MKPITKIILAGIAGTTVMTLYSYYRANKEKQQYREPVLLNRLIDNSPKTTRDISDNHPAGWAVHYGIGIAFVAAYYVFYKRALHAPGPVKALMIGGMSGALALASWKLMFATSDDPPKNNRYGYYRQLFIAHLIFSGTALAGYKALDITNNNTL